MNMLNCSCGQSIMSLCCHQFQNTYSCKKHGCWHNKCATQGSGKLTHLPRNLLCNFHLNNVMSSFRAFKSIARAVLHGCGVCAKCVWCVVIYVMFHTTGTSIPLQSCYWAHHLMILRKDAKKSITQERVHESGILTWLRHFRWNLEFSNSSVHFETRGEIDNPSPEFWAKKHLQSGNHSSSYASSSKEDHTRSGTAPSPSAFAKSWIETRVANDCSGAALSLLDATNLRIEGGVAKHISGTAPSASSLPWMESLCAFPVSLEFNEHDLSWRYSEEKQHSSVLWIWRLPKGRETASNSLVPLPVFFTKLLKVHTHTPEASKFRLLP